MLGNHRYQQLPSLTGKAIIGSLAILGPTGVTVGRGSLPWRITTAFKEDYKRWGT